MKEKKVLSEMNRFFMTIHLRNIKNQSPISPSDEATLNNIEPMLKAGDATTVEMDVILKMWEKYKGKGD